MKGVSVMIWSGSWAGFESCSRIFSMFKGEVAFGLSGTVLFEEK